MELLQLLASLCMYLLISNAAEFTDEQAGLLATGNYDEYDGRHQVDSTEGYNDAGVSAFKNPNAPPPQRLPIHITRPASYPQDSSQEQPYYDYRDENSDLYPNSSPVKQIPPPNNYPSTPSVNASNDPNAPKEYNYHYEKVDDKDPNHITAVHREAHQSTFKYDNSDPSQPSQNVDPAQPSQYGDRAQTSQYDQIVRPVGFRRQGAQTNLNSRYPNQGANSQRTDSAVYPNPQMYNNYPQPANDVSKSVSYPQPTNFNNYPQSISYPQPNNFNRFPQPPVNLDGGDAGLFNKPNDISHNTLDSNTSPYFQDFLSRFKFYPRTADRW